MSAKLAQLVRRISADRVSYPGDAAKDYERSYEIAEQFLNPYESPIEIEPDSDDDADGTEEGRRHHLSNRVMSAVIALPGLLFLIFGASSWFDLLPRSRSFILDHLPPVILIAVVLPMIGIAMLSVSFFLWRYQSPD